MYIYCLQEIRPAAEMGPIILCLDTSGSMRGAREVVAKALALECMRGAHRQQRPCYLYAFSGPGEYKQRLGGSCDSRPPTVVVAAMGRCQHTEAAQWLEYVGVQLMWCALGSVCM